MELKIITEMTIRQFVAKVSNQHQPLSGAVATVCAAQAAALGEACVQISLDNQVDKLNWQQVSYLIAQIASLKEELVKCYDYETNIVSEHLSYMETDKLASPQMLFDSRIHIGRLTLEVKQLLEEFRPHVFADLKPDFEVAVKLLMAATRSNLILLNNYLRTWPEFGAKYEAQRLELQQGLDRSLV